MAPENGGDYRVENVRAVLAQSGYFPPGLFGAKSPAEDSSDSEVCRMDTVLRAARSAQEQLGLMASFLHKNLVLPALAMESQTDDPAFFEAVGGILEKTLAAAADFKREPGFVKAYGELLSVYIFMLYRQGSPGRESPLMRLILTNHGRRKAVELSRGEVRAALTKLDSVVTLGLISKRYAVYVLAARGLKVLFRAEVPFRVFGKSPEGIALQVINLLLKNGVKLAEVTDLVCAGGDVGTISDGIYVLNESLRGESLKRLSGSSLNRGALVTWELRELLRSQGTGGKINASLAGPLSFTTLEGQEVASTLRADPRELGQSLKGYVKVTPLKSIAALLSEIESIGLDSMNLLVMTLDELFASAARKTGPRITREMAAQDANTALSKFDFGKIVEMIKEEGVVIPDSMRLASREIGTGVKEICELLMIMRSGKLSAGLVHGLERVVDAYAGRVAMIMGMASTGLVSERPHFTVIAGMMATDRYFQQLFVKVRDRIETPFCPVLCLDSLEHEYLISSHLYEMYISPSKTDARLQYEVEARNIKQALQVLRVPTVGQSNFSFKGLLERVNRAMSEGGLQPGNLVLVGADNEDALEAAAFARDYGLIKKIVLIGDERDVRAAIEETKLPLLPNVDAGVSLLPTDPLAADLDAKKASAAEVFRRFIAENANFIIMKGSIGTAELLKKALSIYKPKPSSEGQPQTEQPRRFASHTAVFTLPDGRFLALSDAGVNPGFSSPAALLTAVENQVAVVRKLLGPEKTLKVAIITAVEKRTSAIPATLLAAQTVELAGALETAYGPLVIEGPLSFDLATAPDVVEEKHYEGKIRGDADCLVATDINTANVLYKLLTKTMGSLGLLVENGSIITAGPGAVSIVLCSRGDTAQTKFNSILLAYAYNHL